MYLSYYIRQHRDTYYDLLQRVRITGDWEAWLTYFCDGVTEAAHQAADLAQQVLALFERDRLKIEGLGRLTPTALQLHHDLQRHPVTTQTAAAERLGLSLPATIRAMEALEDLGIVREITGRQRGKTYIYSAYLSLLDEGLTH